MQQINDNVNEIFWVERYRPQTIEDCILPRRMKDIFLDYKKAGQFTHLLLSGPPGVGKTTVAKALCNETGQSFILINASESGNIDTLRTTIRDYASTVSLTSQRKVVILDEADYLNPGSTQPALRGFMEEFSSNCTFILTCNYKNKILPPIQGRCSNINFKIEKKEKPEIAAQFYERLLFILKNENITYDENVIQEVVLKYFPDFRRAINELQKYSHSGVIDTGILSQIGELQVKDLMSILKNKDWKTMRSWVVQNLDNDPVSIFRTIYDNMVSHIVPSSLPTLVMILNDGQKNHSFVADPEINLVATLTQVMSEVDFK